MHQDASQPLQHATPLAARPVVGQLRRAQHVQPLPLARNPESRLVQMLHSAGAYQQPPGPARSNSARPAPPCGSSPPASPRTRPPRTGPGRSPPVDPRAGNGRSASTPPWPRSAARTAPARSRPPGTRPASAVRTAGNDSPRPGARSPPAVAVRADHRPADAGARPPPSAAARAAPHSRQPDGRWTWVRSGVSVWLSVAPL